MANLQEIRQQYPQYDDMSDSELADKFYSKFYSDMPKQDFYKKIGYSPKIDKKQEKQPSNLEKYANYAEEYINKPTRRLPQTLLEIGAGAGQGVANTGAGINRLIGGTLNLIPGVNIPKGPTVDIVPHNAPGKVGEFIGSMVGGGEVGKGLEALGKIKNIPYVSPAINKVGEFASGLPTKVKNALNLGKKASKNALIGAAISPEDQGMGAALGAGGTALGYGIGSIPALIKKSGIFSKPGQNVTYHLKPEDVKESFEAGQRLGTNLTPGEASRNPWVAGQESRYKRTPQGSFENVTIGLERRENEKSAINKLLNTIYDKSTASENKIKDLYSKAYKWNIKPEVMDQLKQDPLISRSIERVAKRPAWQRNLKDIPEENLAYLDKVKRDLGAKEQALKRKEGGGGEAREYEIARKDLTKVLNSAPSYKEARKEAQRRIVRSQIEKKLKKAQSEISGTDFYNHIIKNDIEFNKLVGKLKNVPEAQDQLNDMRKAWNSLINLPTSSNEAFRTESALNQARNSIMQYYEMAKDFLGISDSKKAIKYLRGREWYDDLVKAKKSNNKENLDKTLSDIMGKILPASYNSFKGKEIQ